MEISIFDKFNSDNSIFEMWRAIENSDDIVGEATKFQNYVNLIGLCGINKGMKTALDCVFKQVTFDDALKAMMKAFLVRYHQILESFGY